MRKTSKQCLPVQVHQHGRGLHITVHIVCWDHAHSGLSSGNSQVVVLDFYTRDEECMMSREGTENRFPTKPWWEVFFLDGLSPYICFMLLPPAQANSPPHLPTKASLHCLVSLQRCMASQYMLAPLTVPSQPTPSLPRACLIWFLERSPMC